MEQVISIRPADLTEAPLIAALVRAAFEEYRNVLVPPSGALHETAENITHKMQHGGAFIAELNDKPVGCVVYEIRPAFVYFGRLAILPEARGQSIAPKLIQQVEAAALIANRTRVQLGVRLVLNSNRKLFESLGYQVFEYECHPGFTEPTSVTLQKELDKSSPSI